MITDWDRLLTNDINESLGNWQAIFMGIIQDCVPKKVLPKRRNLTVDFMCIEEEVYNMLISLDINKANGPDRISAKMLKETATSITPSLKKLFNISISSGKFPEKWKLSSIIPIPKASGRASPSNYRPIFSTPCCKQNA